MGHYLDDSDLSTQREKIDEKFQTALRYEYLCWEMAYRGEEWPR